MKSNFLKFSLITLSLLPLNVLAQNYNDYDYKYYFVNGMFTSDDQAMDSRAKLRKELLAYKKNHPDEIVLKYTSETDIRYSYNHDENIFTQALEVYHQKLTDDRFSKEKEYSYKDFLKEVFNITKNISEDEFNEKEKLNFIYSNTYLHDDDLNTHVDDYARDISNGSKVILVAHSQGNFYANFAYDVLVFHEKFRFKADTLGIVSVGTPASRVRKLNQKSPYTTLTMDSIMDSVRSLFPNTLPENSEPYYNQLLQYYEGCGGDPFCHGFLEAYMNKKNASYYKIKDDIINVARGLDKSVWKEDESKKLEYIKSCDDRLSMVNQNTNEVIDVYPFNRNGYIYYNGYEWFMAKKGGKIPLQYWTGQKSERECFKLDGTGEIMKMDEIYPCDSTKPSPWIITQKYFEGTSDYKVDVKNKITGVEEYDVYPFNENGYVYNASNAWVMGSCGGTRVYKSSLIEDGKCWLLDGTDEKICGEPIPTFNCNGTKLKEGEFKIKSTVCYEWSYLDNYNYENFYFWFDDATTAIIYGSEGKEGSDGFWDFDRSEQPVLAGLADKMWTNNLYCAYSNKNTIEKWGGNVYTPNCNGGDVYVELTKTKKRNLIGDNKDLCKEGSWEIIKEGDKSSCESNRVAVRNKDNGMILYGVYPFNENGAVYDLDEEFVLGSCGGLKILKDWDGKMEGECYKLEGVNDVIDTKPQFECVGDGRDYGLDIMATYCSYSAGDNGHFWLRDDGFVHIDSSEKGAFASDLAQKYQSCGVLSSSEITNLGGNSYCYEAIVYWGESTTTQSRKIRKVQKVEPLNPNILDTMNDYNKTEYSKKLNQGKGKN